MHSSLKEKLIREIKDIDPSELEEFLALWTIERKVKRHSLVAPKGEVDHTIYFIAEGALKLCCALDDQEIILEFGYTDSCIFNLPSFFTAGPSEFYMEALRATRLIGIRKVDFYNCIDRHLGLAAFWRKNIEYNLLRFVEREVDLLANSPALRLERLQQRRPELFQHIPHKYIAQYLRMTPETLSRLRKS